MNKHLDTYHEVQNIYKDIKAYEQRLEVIRSQECAHAITEIGNYMWAPGHISTGRICQICGELLPHAKSDEPLIGQEYHLDLGAQTPVHVKVLEILDEDRVLVEYLGSTPGRKSTLDMAFFI